MRSACTLVVLPNLIVPHQSTCVCCLCPVFYLKPNPIWLQVQSPLSWITASSVYGALRGLETFGQLVDRIELPKGRADSFSQQASTSQVTDAADALQSHSTAGTEKVSTGSSMGGSDSLSLHALPAPHAAQPADDPEARGRPHLVRNKAGSSLVLGELVFQLKSGDEDDIPLYEFVGSPRAPGSELRFKDDQPQASAEGLGVKQQVLSQADSSSNIIRQATRRLAAVQPAAQGMNIAAGRGHDSPGNRFDVTLCQHG